MRRVGLAAGLLLAGLVAAGCSGDGAPGPTSGEAPAAAASGGERREVVFDLGTADVVDLRPVTVQARPGDVVVLRSGNPGRGVDDESPVHHLFTSAAADAVPPLFVRAAGGHLPNPGVWGLCRGGHPRQAVGACPVAPVDGPDAYDGSAYFSLGALLPGETREVPLAADLPLGMYRFTSAVHPTLHVDVEVVDDPVTPPERAPLDAAAALAEVAEMPATSSGGGPEVVLGPLAAGGQAEVLVAAPGRVRVPVGGRVTWRVVGRSPHTVEIGDAEPPSLTHASPQSFVPAVPPGGRWDGSGPVRSGVLSADPGVRRTTFSLVFDRPGTYVAHDRFHTGLTTVVRVG